MVLSTTKSRSIEDKPFPPSTMETVDHALYRFLDEVLDIKTITSNGFKKVPVIWTSAERLFQSKKDNRFRDADGSLVMPLITVERTNVSKDPSNKGTVWANIPPINDKRGGSISVARRINQLKTANFANAAMKRRKGQLNFAAPNKKIVYQTVTIPLPVYVTVDYQITLRTEYQQQMNQLMTPFITRPGGINYVILEHERLRYEAFIQDSFSHNNNISSFSNEERKFETKLNIQVLGWLTGEDKNRLQPNFSIRENIVEVKIPRERIALSDELDTASGRLYGLEGIDPELFVGLDDKITTYNQASQPGGSTTTTSGGGGGGTVVGADGTQVLTVTSYKTSQAPAESANGSITDFTVPDSFVAGTLMVFRSGILMRVGDDSDYTVSGRTVSFYEAPDTDESIVFSYVKS